MLSLTTLVASSLIGAAVTVPNEIQTKATADKVAILKVDTEEISEPRFICKGCNDNENLALKVMQDRGIKDKNALATILGNIKQESTFVPNICEGGARTSYRGCRSGGYGIIQWTSIDRYEGLGSFALKVGGSPSEINTQLQYIFEEPQWMRIEEKMKTPGKSIDRYMAYAYTWLGWGIHGARTNYAEDYADRLVLDS